MSSGAGQSGSPTSMSTSNWMTTLEGAGQPASIEHGQEYPPSRTNRSACGELLNRSRSPSTNDYPHQIRAFQAHAGVFAATMVLIFAVNLP